MLTEDAPSQTKEFVHCQHVCGTVNAPRGFEVADDRQTLKSETGLQGVASAQTFEPGIKEQAWGEGVCAIALLTIETSAEQMIALADLIAF